MKESVFITKPTAGVMLQTKRSLSEKLKEGKNILLTDTFENVTHSNTELLGIYPYILPFTAYLFENNKDGIIPGDVRNTHYQIGTAENPIPLSYFYENTIGKGAYNESRKHLKSELYQMIKESRKYWLQDKASGNFIFDEPVRIVLVADNNPISLEKFNSLVTKQEGGEYANSEKIPRLGFIIHAYKPLFEGHLNGYKPSDTLSGGFIKQPKCLYAMARYYCNNLPERWPYADYKQFTPVKIIQLFYYLSVHCNDKGGNIEIDMLDMLKHILPSALKDDKIRYSNLSPIVSALAALEIITDNHKENFDMIITGDCFNADDWAYSDRKLKEKAHFNPGQKVPVQRVKYEAALQAMKHHLQANKNKMTIKYIPTKEALEEQKKAIEAAKIAIKSMKKNKGKN